MGRVNHSFTRAIWSRVLPEGKEKDRTHIYLDRTVYYHPRFSPCRPLTFLFLLFRVRMIRLYMNMFDVHKLISSTDQGINRQVNA